MASKWLSSPLARIAFLTGGTVLLTLGINQDENEWIWIGGFLIALAIYLFYSSQKQLREKSWLMLEAIRNRDYSFRLPRHGFIGGERILQNALNEFGAMMGEQKQLMEQRERFYEQVLSGISSGIIVLDEQNKIIQTNPAATRLLGLPALGTLQQLERYGNDIPELLISLPAGERCNLQYATSKGEIQLLVRASIMELGGNTVKILTLNDIRNEMDTKELESWIKLTRVLTHEIMNSIAPISSLSETFLLRKDVIDSPIYEGIRAIHETSTGLISFVDSYRKFSALQKPSPEPFYLKELLLQVKSIHLIPSHIQLTLQIEPDDLMLYADPNLIRQVLINLLKNATQAIGENKGKIHIRAYSTKEEHILVYVSNDGPAIPEKEAEEIFVPFFTTKKEGSGIGLSLSRQIMKLSNGSISLLKAETNGWNTTGQRNNLRGKSDKFISLPERKSAKVMETSGYRLLLPEGTLDYFIISDVKESSTEIVIYLEEKNEVPGEYSSMQVESKGFYEPVVVQDFPIRGKKLFLNIRRRRWIVKDEGRYVSRNWKLVAEGSRITHDFASFLKELY